MGLWQYLEDQLNVEIKFVYLTPEAYATGLSSGNLPDIVATKNNLATILENGVALECRSLSGGIRPQSPSKGRPAAL